MSVPTLLAVSQLTKKHPVFKQGGVRFEIFHAKQNGLEDVGGVVRNGRRVLINEARYFLWIELRSTGELDAVRQRLCEAKKEGAYLTPEDAVAKLRGLVRESVRL